MGAKLQDRNFNVHEFLATNFADRGHQETITALGVTDQRFIVALNAVAEHGATVHRAKSTTSLTIGTGSKSFSAEDTMELKSFFVDGWVHIEDNANSSNWMEGIITAYTPSDGSMTVDVKNTSGSGTIADWIVTPLSERGPIVLPGIAARYQFDTTTSEADPGSGNLRANNSDLTAATKLFIDDEQGDGKDISSALLTMDDSSSAVKGHIQLVNRYTTAQFVLYQVDGLTDEAGYVDVDVTHIESSGSSPFADGEDIAFGFTRSGDQGSAGDVTVKEDGASVGTQPALDVRDALVATEDTTNNDINVSVLINKATDLGSPATGDEILLGDVSNSNAIRKSDIGTILALTTKSDVGLGNVTNDAQMAKDGTVAATGSFDMGGNAVNDAPFAVNDTGTGNYTFVAADAGKLVTGNDSSAQTFTVPDATFPVGTVLTVFQKGSAQITLSAGTGQTINNRQGHTKTAGQYAMISLTQYVADTWVLAGDTA